MQLQPEGATGYVCVCFFISRSHMSFVCALFHLKLHTIFPYGQNESILDSYYARYVNDFINAL